MKKFLLVLAVAGFAVACNNSGKSEETTDTTATTVDTMPAPMVDTTATVDTTMSADTTAAE